MGEQRSEAPRIFLKPPSALVAADEPIIYPQQSREMHYEAELAVVLGDNCANDVTARDLQRRDGQPTWATEGESIG